jgi:hypothetical protein
MPINTDLNSFSVDVQSQVHNPVVNPSDDMEKIHTKDSNFSLEAANVATVVGGVAVALFSLAVPALPVIMSFAGASEAAISIGKPVALAGSIAITYLLS